MAGQPKFLSAKGAQRTLRAVKRIEAGHSRPRQTRRPRHPRGGGGGVSSSQGVKIVLIDADIEGIDESDPQDFLVESEIPLTEDEVTAGYTVVFQDPPDDDYSENQVDNLNLWRYRRQQVALKYYATSDITGQAQSGATSTTIKFSHPFASTEDDFYNGDVVTITEGPGAGDTRTITNYVGASRTATVNSAWSTNPTNSSFYSIITSKNSALAHTVIDDAAGERKIVRYATIDAWYDDGKSFLVGEYKRADYPAFPENDPFPPPGLPEGFLNRRFRGVVINNVLITALCKVLPPPELP